MAFSKAYITRSGKDTLEKYKSNPRTFEAFLELADLAKVCSPSHTSRLIYASKQFSGFAGVLWRVKKKKKQERIIFVHNRKFDDGYFILFFLRGQTGDEKQEYKRKLKKSDVARHKSYDELTNDPDNEVFEEYVIKIK